MLSDIHACVYIRTHIKNIFLPIKILEVWIVLAIYSLCVLHFQINSPQGTWVGWSLRWFIIKGENIWFVSAFEVRHIFIKLCLTEAVKNWHYCESFLSLTDFIDISGWIYLSVKGGLSEYLWAVVICEFLYLDFPLFAHVLLYINEY